MVESANRKPVIARAVRALRYSLGITQAALAATLGTTPTTVFRYEAGRVPTKQICVTLASLAAQENLQPLALLFLMASHGSELNAEEYIEVEDGEHIQIDAVLEELERRPLPEALVAELWDKKLRPVFDPALQSDEEDDLVAALLGLLRKKPREEADRRLIAVIRAALADHMEK